MRVLLWAAVLAMAGICRAEAEFTITKDLQPYPMVGFGVQMNPYLYATPNWGDAVVIKNRLPMNPAYFQPFLGDVTAENVKGLEEKIVALSPQHVRIFFLLDWFGLIGEERLARGDPRMRESFIRTVRLAQRAGATVNLTLWYGKLMQRDPEAAARRFSGILVQLVRDEKLTAIQYITFQNEVNLEGRYGSMRLTWDQYNRLYRTLDSELKKAGMREHFKLVGGDLVSREQVGWINYMGWYMSDVLDAYSEHMYWDYWDTPKLMKRVSEVPPIVDAMPQRAHKPVQVTEFGVRGVMPDHKTDPGEYWDFRPVAQANLQALEIGWFMMEALNRGYTATVQWEAYDVWYDRRMGYGVIGQPGDGWKLKPGYWVQYLFTHTAKPGWRAVKVKGEDLRSGVAAVRGENGEQTVYVSNRSEKRQSIVVRDLRAGEEFLELIWNGDGEGDLKWGEALRADQAGFATIDLPPMSIIALVDGPTRPWARIRKEP